jgi:hypothetical protein
MGNILKMTLLGIPLLTWLAQLAYVIVFLVILGFIVSSFDRNSVPVSSTKLFVVIYIVVMIVADIIWRIAIKNEHYTIVIITIIIAIVLNIVISQLVITRNAHSSFENYYKYRGCSELISKSASSALCNLPSGETIKLVEVKGKWYTDGDPQSSWF